jgi:tRNA (adenine22-N1)-methyltransferase
MIPKRITDIASLIPAGVPLYDVGTDHGFLPIFAVERLGAPFAVASDVAEKSLLKAQLNIKGHNLCDKISTVLCDGLETVNLEKPCAVAVCGMGGLLISRIISEKEELKDPLVSMILQPMTKETELRKYLWSHGFEIEKELVSNDGRLYTVMLVRYSGEQYFPSEFEAMAGKNHIDRHNFSMMLKKKKKQLEAIVAGKLKAGIDARCETRLLQETEEKLESL